MELLINELSLEGQYKTIEDFINELEDMIKILKIAEENSIIVLKSYNFYRRQVTNHDTLSDVLKIKGKDEIRRIKIFLSRLFDPPYWEETQQHNQEAQYALDDVDIYGTSIAEASKRDKVIASFRHNGFKESKIEINVDEETIIISNVISKLTFVDYLYKDIDYIDELTYCNHKFENTRLSFERFDSKYGFMQLEKKEVEMVLDTFERIIKKVNWGEIYSDQSLNFKEYKPENKKKNWFSGTSYEGKKVDKFRCGNTAVSPLRCFGYKEGEIFYPLRLERDHKISDNG